MLLINVTLCKKYFFHIFVQRRTLTSRQGVPYPTLQGGLLLTFNM